MPTLFDDRYPYNTQQLSNAQWQAYFNQVCPDGVLTYLGSTPLAVTERGAGANMSVDVATGAVSIQGVRGINSATKNLTIANADPTNPRIDVVVARLDQVANPIEIEFDVLTGTPAGAPSAPTLTQTSTNWEVELAQVAVAAAAGSIVNANITDRRSFSSGRGFVVLPTRASAATLPMPVWVTGPTMAITIVSGTTTITTISPLPAGSILVLRFSSASCQVTDGSNLFLNSNFISDGTASTLTLLSDGTNYVEIGRSSPRISALYDPNGNPIVSLQTVASQVSYLDILPSVTGSPSSLTLRPISSDADVDYVTRSKGTASHRMQNSSGTLLHRVRSTGLVELPLNGEVIIINSGTQAISATTVTTLVFDTEPVDPLNEFDIATEVFTPVATGTYVFYFKVTSAGFSAADRVILYVNFSATPGTPLHTVRDMTIDAATDMVEACVPIQVTGGTGLVMAIFISNARTLATGTTARIVRVK